MLVLLSPLLVLVEPLEMSELPEELLELELEELLEEPEVLSVLVPNEGTAPWVTLSMDNVWGFKP